MKQTEITPNIFDYATSELSQDAFLCWLIACASCDEQTVQQLGLDFIQFLYDCDSKNTDSKKVEKLLMLKNQYKKIDVYFQAQIGGKIVSFIIEDKTDTEMHSNQLKRYRDKVREDKIAEGEIKGIYFKTGYIFSDERERAEESGYGVISLENFVDFLQEKNINNDIFKDYFAYISNMYENRKEESEKAADFYEGQNGEKYSDVFWHKHVQWEFMLSLQRAVKDVFVKCKKSPGFDFIYTDTGDLDKGVNRGGSPWTHFSWGEIQGKYKDKNIKEYIFWRLEGWYQLRLCQGVWPKKTEIYDDYDKDRKKRLYRFREIFEEEAKLFGTALKKPSGKTGNLISSIGIILFNSPENSVQNILARMPEFHDKFIRQISKEG